MNPLFSIIVTAAGPERNIGESLASLAGQSLSPDQTEVMVVAPAQGAGRGERLGWGLERAKGEYVLFLEGGDGLRSDALEAGRSLIEESRPDMVRFGLKNLDRWGNQVGPEEPPRPGILFSAGRLPVFFRRDFLMARGPVFPLGDFSEDADLSAAILARAAELRDISASLYLRLADEVATRPSPAEIAAGAVVLMANVDYAVRHLARVGRRLQSWGHRVFLADLSPNFGPKRCLPSEEAATLDDLHYRVLCLDEDELLYPAARAYVLAADWGVFRPLAFRLKERKIPVIGFYEGIHDDFLLEPPVPPFKSEFHYRHTDYLLIPGDYYRDIYGDRKTFVAGLPEIGAFLNEEPDFPATPLALINVNFSYGVLENRRDLFLSTAVAACRRLGWPFLITQHPADLADLGDLPRSENRVYDDLRRCTVLISRFSTCIIEALALGKPVIYHNPHGEKFPKFQSDPMGAFEVSASEDDLVRALGKVLRERPNGFDVRARARPWLRHHAGLFGPEAPEITAARAVAEILQTHEAAFQGRILHLAARPDSASGPVLTVGEKPDPAATMPAEDIRPQSVDELRERLGWALVNGDGRRALGWLDEYELRRGRDDWAKSREEELNVWCQERGRGPLSAPVPARPPALDLAGLKDKFVGQRAFVVGSGPSLRRMKLDRLKKEITLGVNGVFMMGLTPTFHLADEKRVAADVPGAARLAPLSGPVKIYGPELASWLGADGETIFPNLIPDPGPRFGGPYFSVDAAARLWSGGSTPYLSLQLAYYLGFSEVFLIGFDHTMPQNAGVAATEAGYRKAGRAFELAGRRLVNATPGGRLEIFERVDFEGIFEKGGPATVEGRLGVDWLADWRQKAKKRLVSRRQRRPAPEVAVIVPVYNVEAYVHKALTSIMNQTFEDLEIIVVDQSDDAGPEIIRRLAEEDPRIRVLRQEEKSPGLARNRGLAASSAPWLTFVDADDFVEPDLVGSLWREATKEGLDLVNGLVAIDEDGQDRYEEYNQGVYQTPQEAVKDLLRGAHSGMVCGRLYRRNLFTDKCLAFPGGLFEDLALVYRLYLEAERVGTVSRSLYHWRWRPGSRTLSMSRKHMTDVFAVMDSRYDFLKAEPGLWEKYKEDYCQGLWSLLNWLRLGLAGQADLTKELMLNIIKRDLYGRQLLDSIKDQRTAALARAVLEPLLFPAALKETDS